MGTGSHNRLSTAAKTRTFPFCQFFESRKSCNPVKTVFSSVRPAVDQDQEDPN